MRKNYKTVKGYGEYGNYHIKIYGLSPMLIELKQRKQPTILSKK